MPFQLVVLRGRAASQTIRLASGSTVVGRQDGSALQIRDSLVSRKHCRITERNERLFVCDLGSSNGTFVNGQKVADEDVEVPHGAELSIGGVKFRAEKVGAPVAAGAPTQAPGRTPIGDMPGPADSGAPLPIEDEVMTVDAEDGSMKVPASAPTITSAPMKPPAPAPAPEPPANGDAQHEPARPEMSEDAVADFLFNLEVDEDDKV